MNAIDLAHTVAETLSKDGTVPSGMTYSVIDDVLKVKMTLEDTNLKNLVKLEERVQQAMELGFNAGPLVVRIDMNKLKGE